MLVHLILLKVLGVNITLSKFLMRPPSNCCRLISIIFHPTDLTWFNQFIPNRHL